ncbi:hypothetical protein EVAR_18809_1 [Eumeta japonica]|uniref:Uncharacterized protein n=1 Tax=Eumeta variegata TaxID=151549 RepID=A0A4C1UMW7_EUMVA|nr:hypothetical protein EVAR_18809_1 [Eumeta japonica]
MKKKCRNTEKLRISQEFQDNLIIERISNYLTANRCRETVLKLFARQKWCSEPRAEPRAAGRSSAKGHGLSSPRFLLNIHFADGSGGCQNYPIIILPKYIHLS